MNEFAVVSEGVTDFAVLKNILVGWFKGQPVEPALNPYQPDPNAAGESAWQQFGGWENVLHYLREKKYQGALQFADYLIIQIDTDQSEHPNFGVPQMEGGTPLEPAEMVARVIAFLQAIIGPKECEFYGDRIIFAICVREMECWLLPLWDPQKAAKCEGCLRTLNQALSRQNERGINPEDKDTRRYDHVSKGYRKRATLVQDGLLNPSLGLFLEELQNRQIQLIGG